jgi:hypothetical protein
LVVQERSPRAALALRSGARPRATRVYARRFCSARSTRIQYLQAQIRTAKQTPDELTKMVKQIETSSRSKLADLRAALAGETDRREAFLALFPAGLVFARRALSLVACESLRGHVSIVNEWNERRRSSRQTGCSHRIAVAAAMGNLPSAFPKPR